MNNMDNAKCQSCINQLSTASYLLIVLISTVSLYIIDLFMVFASCI